MIASRIHWIWPLVGLSQWVETCSKSRCICLRHIFADFDVSELPSPLSSSLSLLGPLTVSSLWLKVSDITALWRSRVAALPDVQFSLADATGYMRFHLVSLRRLRRLQMQPDVAVICKQLGIHRYRGSRGGKLRRISVVNDRRVYACMSTLTSAIKQHGLVNCDGLIHKRCTTLADNKNTLNRPIVYSINPTTLAKDSALVL